MGYTGNATWTIDVATFNGEYRLGYDSTPVLCQAPDHLIEVMPTGAVTTRLPILDLKHGGAV